MKSSFTFIILCLLLTSSLRAQTYSEIISDDKIQDFVKLNQKHLGKKKLGNQVLYWNQCDLFKDLNNCFLSQFIQNENDPIITEKVLKELQTQFSSLTKNSPTTFSFLKSKSNKRTKFSSVSIPLIVNDESLAIIKKSIWCGNKCGGGGILIFKKDENQIWKRIDYRSTWIN